jgi:hypothetical protein
MVMKYVALCGLLLAGNLRAFAEDKLTDSDRIEIVRGLTAEYATAKISLPRSRKPLEFQSKGTYDKAAWADAGRQLGPAARVGDLVQVTKVSIEKDRILLEINNGLKTKKKWYEHIEVGMGGSTQPVSQGQNTNAPGGTYIAVVFGDGVPLVKASEIKKMLAPVLDFEKHSATEQYTETLPEPIKQAIAAKKAIEGMDHEQVLLAMGRPLRKSRETKDGLDYEDWIYGQAPGRITFVTFQNSKVVKVKEAYAGLGGSTADTTPVP